MIYRPIIAGILLTASNVTLSIMLAGEGSFVGAAMLWVASVSSAFLTGMIAGQARMIHLRQQEIERSEAQLRSLL